MEPPGSLQGTEVTKGEQGGSDEGVRQSSDQRGECVGLWFGGQRVWGTKELEMW